MNQKKLQREETKKKIAEAAGQLFAQKGYAATSIGDIVAATGKSKGNIYYHFGSKEGLFLHLLDEWERGWKDTWSEKLPSLITISDKLSGLAQIMVNDLNHPLTQAMNEFFSSEWDRSEVQASVTNYYTDHIAFNQEMIQSAMANGELAEDDTRMLAIILEAMMQGLYHMSPHIGTEKSLDLYRKAVTVFLQGTVKPDLLMNGG
ncbi:TetR/AcrR family transcriptional regulator [Paenibacillus oryzisoli]|uniref:TetR family transcriptional regulator n=1 Tax=Paenibacillus oryzisoli TaxID=1850517 RepID=A0A198A0V8_9BACL|nr:TetR/AcrR family transcriptional regulator [Paenibacillus oryzisoli]OAS14815.1 TetR family transcriptional regulator [Paenibacillus oryzisoli]